MSQAELQSILSAVGHLAEITLGEVGGTNDPAFRLAQVNNIIEWTHQVKLNLEAEVNLRVQTEEELFRLRSAPTAEELLTTIDRRIQAHMQELGVDIALGSELLPRVMQVVEAQFMILIQEIDDVTAQANNLVAQLDNANLRLADYEEQERIHAVSPGVTVVESQFVTTSQETLPNSGHIELLSAELLEAKAVQQELEEVVARVQEENAQLRQRLEEAQVKNGQLVSQLSFSNSKIEELEVKFLQNSNKASSASSLENDANIKIISELKDERERATLRVNELVQQVIDANSRVEELERKLAKKSSVHASPVQESIEVRGGDHRLRELQTELIAKQEEVNALSATVRSSEARINQLISELVSANGEAGVWRNKFEGVNVHEKEETIANLNYQVEELARQLSDAARHIVELEQQPASRAQDHKSAELATLLAHAERKNTDLLSQISLANNRITDLQLDLETAAKQGTEHNGPLSERESNSIAHALMVSEKKVREMQRIVANYQNNVQDLTLDKERLGFELEHAQSLQHNYLSDLDVERASVAALRRQVVDMKDGFRGIARDNLREIEGEIADNAHGREAHRHEELEKS